MKFSEQWLREWVNPAVNTEQLISQITMAGLEVDGSEPAAEKFSGIVVAEVLSAEQHPNADKLRVCMVSDGTEEFQVVCGAPNARAGIKVAFAKVGAVLPGDFKIKKAKLRQVESFGMLCSESELGLSDDHDGILELPAVLALGADLRTALGLDDVIIEVDLTPNRADCLSIRGLAREVAVLNSQPFKDLTLTPVAAQIEDTFPVKLLAPQACPVYAGRVIRDVNVAATTPVWMVEKLRRSGVRSIDPVVDVTNYVMLELGQPMHGFDLNQLSNGIQVRMAEASETLTLLDGSEINLTPDTLMIADSAGSVAMAGVMGGENSGVSAETKDIFFESAYFDPITIAGKARSFGLHTDASHRFERGVDPLLHEIAIERATALLLEIAGGKPGPTVVTKSEQDMPENRTVTLNLDKVSTMLGIDPGADKVKTILTGLGLQLVTESGSQLAFKVPSFRFDISIEADLMEEIARIYGYNNIPVTTPEFRLPVPEKPETLIDIRRIKNAMVDLGYQEAVTYSFIAPELQAMFDPDIVPVALANPISADMSVMRTSLIPGLISALQYNLNRQADRVRLFETGLSFIKSKELVQDQMLAGICYGSRLPKGWINQGDVDFYDLKGDLENILALSLGRTFSFEAGNRGGLHPGQTAAIKLDDQVIGYLGALHPAVAKKLELRKSVYAFEIRLDAIKTTQLPEFEELSKFPGTSRDIAVIVDSALPVNAMLSSINEIAGPFIAQSVIFDVYQGKGIDDGFKSVAMGISWQHPERTLNEEEINQWMDNIVQMLKQNYKATLRG